MLKRQHIMSSEGRYMLAPVARVSRPAAGWFSAGAVLVSLWRLIAWGVSARRRVAPTGGPP